MATRKLPPTYQLKISLNNAKPPIWRRVLVAGNITFADLHDIIQCSMGWVDVHLHMFSVGQIHIGEPEDNDWLSVMDERKARLGQFLQAEKQWCSYEYDFGDSWTHKITLEKILPPDPALPRCIKAKGACPPEDVGGIWGYEAFLEGFLNPAHPKHLDCKKWVGDTFQHGDPDLADINQSLQSLTLHQGVRT